MKQKTFLSRIKTQAAFTMIELLIVIAILGILAVAVLAAINPIEQINRGRDTGSRSDSEQLLSAIDRFYAYKGYYPWVQNANATSTLAWRGVSGDTAISYDDAGTTVTIDPWLDAATGGCTILDKISNGNSDGSCAGTNEVKRSFVDKVTKSDYNHLYVYYNGEAGSSLYVCFKPQSGAMQKDATDRCGTAGAGLPGDLSGAKASVCAAGKEYICLP